MESKLKLILNGGQRVLDSATVPVKWFFSEEVIKKSPESILIVDLTAKDLASKPEYIGGLGERTLINVRKGNQFIQFDNHGIHKLLVLVFKEIPVNGSFVEKLFARDAYKYDNGYKTTVFPSGLEKFISGEENDLTVGGYTVVAAEIIDLEIPKELFAPEPKTKWEKRIFKWINYWHGGPRDECSFRKRAAFAFTLKPFFYLIGELLIWRFLIYWIIWNGVIAIAVKALLIIWRLFIILLMSIFGAYPYGDSWSGFGEALVWPLEGTEWTDFCGGFENTEYKEINGKRYLLAPWHLLSVGLVVYSVYSLFTIDYGQITWSSNWLILPGLLIVLGFVIFYIAEVEAKYRKRNPKRTYQEWLLEEANLKNAPASITEKDLSVSFDNKFVNSGRIKFWALKAKVCRPFAKNA